MKITIVPCFIFSLFLFFGSVVLAGCSDQSASSGNNAAASPAAPAASPAAAAGAAGGSGETVFASNCKGCHAINGQGGKKGPDLSHTGAEAEHTAAWFSEFIKNPKSKDPHSRMPGFQGRISDADLQTLSAYLVTLK